MWQQTIPLHENYIAKNCTQSNYVFLGWVFVFSQYIYLLTFQFAFAFTKTSQGILCAKTKAILCFCFKLCPQSIRCTDSQMTTGLFCFCTLLYKQDSIPAEYKNKVFRSFHKSERSDIFTNVVNICLCVNIMLP